MQKHHSLLLACLLPIGCATSVAPSENATPVQDHAASTRCVKPAYPALSRRLGEQGKVLVRAFVETNGKVSTVEVVQSSGYLRLDQAASVAAKCWTFVPGKANGAPAAMWYELPVNFQLQ